MFSSFWKISSFVSRCFDPKIFEESSSSNIETIGGRHVSKTRKKQHGIMSHWGNSCQPISANLRDLLFFRHLERVPSMGTWISLESQRWTKAHRKNHDPPGGSSHLGKWLVTFARETTRSLGDNNPLTNWGDPPRMLWYFHPSDLHPLVPASATSLDPSPLAAPHRNSQPTRRPRPLRFPRITLDPELSKDLSEERPRCFENGLFGCWTKNRGGKPPKMDGENNGKPLWTNGWFGGETPPIFCFSAKKGTCFFSLRLLQKKLRKKVHKRSWSKKKPRHYRGV